ncbi:MAG: hypothetical protein E6Q67_12915 [Roseateles sp.]|nr:MAG: hypothetical protein E6Q67_12915 [Roseateles sp.]
MATVIHRNNFLAPEPYIVARLKEALAGQAPAVHVLTVADLDGVKEAAQLVPAVHVLLGDFKPIETNTMGTRARVQCTWLVVAAVRNLADVRSGAAARMEAGELIARASAALMGFQLPNCATPMRLAPAPRAWPSKGYLYVPLAFTVETVLSN